MKNSLEILDTEFYVKVRKRFKQKHACVFFFLDQSYGVRYQEVNFVVNVHVVLKKSVRYNKYPP